MSGRNISGGICPEGIYPGEYVREEYVRGDVLHSHVTPYKNAEQPVQERPIVEENYKRDEWVRTCDEALCACDYYTMILLSEILTMCP